MTRPSTTPRRSHQTSALLSGSGPVLALLSGSHVVDDLYQGAVPALLPFLAIERHYTYTGLTGITLAATFLSSAIQPAFGVLTDRRRMGWLIPAGLLVAGVGIGLAGLGGSYLFTWLAVALSGVGVAAYHPAAVRTARAIAGDSTQVMSWFSVGGTAGIALAPVLVSPVLLATGLAGTPVLALPAVLMAWLLAVRRPWDRANAAGPARSAGEDAAGGPRRDDWRGFARLAAMVTVRSVAYFGLASLLALFVIRRFHEPTAVGSAALTAFVAAGAAGSLAGGWLADRWRRAATIRLGYACAIPALLLLAAAPDVVVAFGAIIVSGLALFTPFAVQVTLGQDYLPNRIGTASGVTLGLAMSIGGLASPLFGVLADGHGLPVTLAILAAFPAAALALTFRLREPRPAGRG